MSIFCGLFSRIIPQKIIYCSEKSIKFHEKNHFYSKSKTILIYNGYSDKNYYSSSTLRLNFRKKNKIRKTDIILGYAGRYAKQKNIQSLLHAFSQISKNYENVYLYMVGKDISVQNEELFNKVSDLDIKNKVFFLNEQKNLLQFYNGIDLLLLTSHSESFPNVIAESMLCSTPVLSSNAGCSKKIIGKYGLVLKKNDYLSITKGLKNIINKFINKKKKMETFKKKCAVTDTKKFFYRKNDK